VYVEHEPVWAPAQLATDLDGNAAPGWECVHLLENGNGTCGGNVFRIEDAVGNHGCLVQDDGDQKRWSKRTLVNWGGATPNPYGELEAKSD
jgi:hypothetical protein